MLLAMSFSPSNKLSCYCYLILLEASLVQINQADGTTNNVIVQPVKFCASAKANPLSITTLLSQDSIFMKDSTLLGVRC